MADHDGSVPATNIWLIMMAQFLQQRYGGSCNKDMADHDGSVPATKIWLIGSYNKDMADHDGSVPATKIWLIMMARFLQQRYG